MSLVVQSTASPTFGSCLFTHDQEKQQKISHATPPQSDDRGKTGVFAQTAKMRVLVRILYVYEVDTW